MLATLTATPLLLLLPFIHAVGAVPTPISIGDILGNSSAVSSSGMPTELSQDAINAQFLRPAQFTRVVYCPTSAVTSWQCGAPCADLGAGVEVLQAGGDFIAHDSATQSIVVAHQGTEPDM
ncbi:hypothetical protein C0992_010414 [Termitomyces sp. T32_za158]|nr:hypothetical protein C0992_010414 [Termitomyces sp. T32_za158]